MSPAATPGDSSRAPVRSGSPPPSGWDELFWSAFTNSRNAMALVDAQRRYVEVNGAHIQLLGYRRGDLIGRPVYEHVAGGPIMTATEWGATITRDQFTGVAEMIRADGGTLTAEWAGHPAVVTGTRLILFVAMRTSRRSKLRGFDTPQADALGLLSGRELEVVGLIAMGASGPEIAAELQLAHNTVRTHVRNAMAKVGARSRAHLVAKALGEGLVWREATPASA
jgi:PAS domain S-box-containing protein